jgi:hypothetical protein
MRAHLKLAAVVLSLAMPVAAADALSQLGITPEAAKEVIGTVITAGIYNPGLPAQTFKALSPAARAQAVTAGVAWLKAYTATPEFARQYAQAREHQKPEPPSWDRTPEQELQQQDEEAKQQLEESKAVLATLPPDQRKTVEDALKAAADMNAKMNTPEARKMKLDAMRADRAEETRTYEAALAKWQQDYPDQPRQVIARRLREFLQLSADVDFGAALQTANGRSVFVNPTYQAKSSQWKLCYRAGREATAAARAAAQAWLTEIGG